MRSFSTVMFRKGKFRSLLSGRVPCWVRRGVLGALLAVLLTATGTWAAAPTVRVLATTYPVYLLTRAVTRNSPDIQVDLLIPAQTGCPHDYALSPGDMRKLTQARVVVMNGLGMEAFLQKALPTDGSIAVIDSGKGVDVIKEAAEDAHAHEPEDDGHAHEGHGHDHGGVNPHAFSSPRQAAVMVRNIGQGLAKAAPEAAANCPATADAYAARLEALGERLAAVGAHAARKNVIALHDGMAYLLRDAGLNLVAVIQEDEESQPSAARLLELVRIIKKTGPVALVSEPQYSEKPVRTLSEETGVPVARLDPLASGPLDAPLSYYETVMDANSRILGTHFDK